ncbi:MAG: hypothetical protein SCH68_12420, partial [Brevefilum sp.]|nr:hypothetical protein [Brevefilum sp.]
RTLKRIGRHLPILFALITPISSHACCQWMIDKRGQPTFNWNYNSVLAVLACPWLLTQFFIDKSISVVFKMIIFIVF